MLRCRRLLTTEPTQGAILTTEAALVDRLKLANERGLVAAQHVKSVKLETMQAFAVYLVNTLPPAHSWHL